MDHAASPRILRYNAKTSLTTRCPNLDNTFERGYLLRSGNEQPNSLDRKPTKKRSPPEDADFVDIELQSKKGRTARLDMIQPNLEASTNLNPLSENLLKTVGGHGVLEEERLYIYICSLPCGYLPKLVLASSVDPSQDSARIVALREKASPLKMSSPHWHLHHHRGGCTYTMDPEPVDAASSACLELQVIQGALARMKTGRTWPADEGLLDEFYRINGGNALKVLDGQNVLM